FIRGGKMKKALYIIKKTLNFLAEIGLYMAIVSLILMTVLIVVEIISRSFFNWSTLIADEVSGYLNAAIVYLGLAYTFKKDGFVKVTILYNFLSSKVKKILDITSPILALLFSLTFIYIIINSVSRVYFRYTTSTGLLRIPLYIPQSVMII